MKKLLHTFTGCAQWLILLALGLAILVVTVAGSRCQGQNCWLWVLDSLRPHRITAMLGSGGVVILGLLHILTRPSRPKEFESLEFKAKGGKVSVNVDTIRAALATLTDEFEGVAGLEPKVSRTGRHVDVELEVRMQAGTDVPKICTELKDRSRQVIADQVGLFKLREVRIHIGELVRSSRDTRPAEAVNPTAGDPNCRETVTDVLPTDPGD